MFSRLSTGGLLVIALCVSGCVIQPLDPYTMDPSSDQDVSSEDRGPSVRSDTDIIQAYVLKPMDPIFIRFSGVSDQQSLDVVIDEKGEINLLHIAAPVMAAGLTTSALEDKIEELYVDGDIYVSISVNVTMTAKAYYVQGEVNTPGKFQLMSGTTLMQALAEARGPSAFASRKVTITRQGKIYQFDWKELEKDPSKDVKIEPGDVVKVWQSWY